MAIGARSPQAAGDSNCIEFPGIARTAGKGNDLWSHQDFSIATRANDRRDPVSGQVRAGGQEKILI